MPRDIYEQDRVFVDPEKREVRIITKESSYGFLRNQESLNIRFNKDTNIQKFVYRVIVRESFFELKDEKRKKNYSIIIEEKQRGTTKDPQIYKGYIDISMNSGILKARGIVCPNLFRGPDGKITKIGYEFCRQLNDKGTGVTTTITTTSNNTPIWKIINLKYKALKDWDLTDEEVGFITEALAGDNRTYNSLKSKEIDKWIRRNNINLKNIYVNVNYRNYNTKPCLLRLLLN